MPELSPRDIQTIDRNLRRIPTAERGEDAPQAVVETDGFWAEITGDESGAGSGPTGFSWKMIQSNGAGATEDHLVGATGTGTAFEINGIRGVHAGARVWMRLAGFVSDGSSGQVPIFLFAASSPVVPLLLTQTGGSAGDGSAACTFTYTVKSIDAVEIATGVDPTATPHQYARPSLGRQVAATSGLGYWKDDLAGGRELVVSWINEAPGRGSC